MTPGSRQGRSQSGGPARRRRLALWRRAIEVAGIVTVHATRLAARSMHRLVVPSSASRAALLGRALTDLVEALGATFVKVGQVLSARPDLLPGDVISQLKRLQQGVAPFPESQLEGALRDGLDSRVADAFASIDPVPIASASLANVYRARLHDGRLVAVKVRRPGLARQIDDDLAIFRAIARLLQRVPALRVVPITGVANEVAEAIRRQLDFAQEAANNRRFHANFAGHDGVALPELVDELCSPSVLTMVLLDDLRRLDTLRAGEDEAERLAVVGLDVLYKMVFLDGFVHVDMHPGNIFAGPGGEFVVLDFGLVAELSDLDRRTFARFFVGIATNDGRTCARIVRDTAQELDPAFDAESFEASMVALISSYSGLDAHGFEVARFAVDLFDVQRRHGVRGSTNFTLVIVSFVVFEGIVKQMAPTLDFQAQARAFLASSGGRVLTGVPVP